MDFVKFFQFFQAPALTVKEDSSLIVLKEMIVIGLIEIILDS